MSPCHEYAALLDAYVDGELSPEEMARVRTHLDACPGCRAYVDDALAIRAAFPDAEETEVPEGFADSVSAAIRAGAAPQRKRRPRWLRTAAPLAACCALVILLSQLPGLGGNDAVRRETAAEDSAMAAAQQPETEKTQDIAAMDETDGAAGDDASPETPTVYMAQGAPESQDAADEAENSPAPSERNTDALEDGGTGGDTAGSQSETPSQDEASDNVGTEETDAAPQDDPQVSVNTTTLEPEEPDAWVAYENVVFAAVVYLPADVVGDALDGYEGKPYSDANCPEGGVIGTGYALDQETFEHVLDMLDAPQDPTQNQDATTERCCIVVTEG